MSFNKPSFPMSILFVGSMACEANQDQFSSGSGDNAAMGGNKVMLIFLCHKFHWTEEVGEKPMKRF